MSAYDLVLIVLVAAGAFFAGYQLGRFKALAERDAASRADNDQPLPGPSLDRPYSGPAARPRGAPPPSSAGGDAGSWPETGETPAGRGPVRRSSKPPPAAAGLMGTGETDKPGKGQK